MPKRERRLIAAVGLCALATAAAGGGAVGSTGAIHSCRAGDYSIELGAWKVGGNLLVAAGILTKGGPACRVSSTIRIGVRYHPGNLDLPRGPLRPVRGNPARWQVSTVPRPWSQLVRTWTWRNWCRRPRSVFAFLTAASGLGSDRIADRVAAPACRDRRASSVFVDNGVGLRPVPFVGDRIAAHLLSPDAPIPVSPTLIRVRNGWLVSDGRTLVAVYAGQAGNDSANGRIVVVRQNLVFGVESQDVVAAGHTGAVSLTRVPLGRAVETSAQRADLSFVSAGGERGVLRLASDSVTIAP